ncbi:MAG: hypothetical protein ACKO9H_14155, partial [Planctomycetota bacterium]
MHAASRTFWNSFRLAPQELQAYLPRVAFGTGLASPLCRLVAFRSGQPFRGYQLPDIPGAIC